MQPCHVKESFSCTSFNNHKGASTEYTSIIHHIDAVSVIHDKMFKELSILRDGKDLVSLNVKFLNAINTATNADGTLDGEKFEEIINDLKMNFEMKMASQSTALVEKSKTDPKALHQLNHLSEKAQPFLDFFEDTLKIGNEIKKDAKIFSKEQLERFTTNINRNVEELNSENQLQILKTTKLNNEANERQQSARQMLRTHAEMFKDILRKLRVNH